ncbi:MAG: dihydropteroate synthase [Kiritimatiellia bacterium]|jgi:dihydropteroate synthase
MNDDKVTWPCRDRTVTLACPAVMGILNVTPDSFSDGGKHDDLDAALAHAARMLEEGAAILDVGGESTRPGFTPVPAEEEKRRLLPVVRELRRAFPDCVISIDTMKASVAEATLEAGADIINDVAGLADPRMAAVVRDTGAGYVLMHGYAEHAGAPRAEGPGRLGAWMAEGTERLLARALAGGIARERIVLDPGFGFGKKRAENAEALQAVPLLIQRFGLPMLIGASRKHFVNGLHPEAGGDAVKASVAFAVDALRLGGRIFRVHDVLESCTALANALQ